MIKYFAETIKVVCHRRGSYKLLILILVLSPITSFSQEKSGFQIIKKQNEKKIDVLYNGKLLTSYCYFDSIRKPFLYPIKTVDGITVTRGYPIDPVVGERTDHPHHTGMWLNYESVNGLDFWNNSTAIPKEKRVKYGTIFHRKLLAREATKETANLSVKCDWVGPNGNILLEEKTSYVFRVQSGELHIDRTTTLTAINERVDFKDVKDGLLAIRVARELEMPSQEPGKYFSNDGTISNTSVNNNITGSYYSSTGLKGDFVWGTKGSWAMLQGVKDGKEITIAILDHPSNIGYPSYWHARGYGLFSINPLGRKVFSKGTEELNFSLKKTESVTFKYRVIVASEKKSAAEIGSESIIFQKEN